jgi:hypothetical protein
MTNPDIDIVTSVLEHYAKRGIFRGYSATLLSKNKATYKLVWHREQKFEFVADMTKQTLRIPIVLPEVPADSDMYKAFKAYVKKRTDQSLPEHRKIDEARTQIKAMNRAGNISLTAKCLDEDYDYSARKLIHLVHEIYMDFLMDGNNYDYLIETFNIDPDAL